MHDLIASLEPEMEYICKVSGATELSLSVVSGGKEAYAKHLGFRDVEAKKAPDVDTTYFIGSVTKDMVAALLGILVEEGGLQWSAHIASILPELQDSFEARVARSDGIWIQRAGNILLPKSESIRTWVAQPVVRDFRSGFLYNNYAYGVIGRAIEKIEGKSLEETFKEKLWEPLGMHRTSMEDIPGNSNAAKAYYAPDDATSYGVPIPTISHETIMRAAGAIRSCTNDLAKYYSNFMHAANHQFSNKTASTPNSPFKQLTTILRPYNQLDLISFSEQSYALGSGRAQLPCPLGTLSYNYLLTAILPMQNSSGLGDACDWIPHMIIQKLSGSTENIDFRQLSSMAAKAAPALAEKIEPDLEKGRERGTKHLGLEAYTGHYWNALHNFRIDVSVRHGRLYMKFQGIENENYELRYYYHHSWIWNVSHNDTAKQGRFPTRPWSSYIIEFNCGD
ncbi:beta-lactamase/transpeptidase-like protein [Fusarium redolens]|uniref:Beta-lactamase/transpeptidase-like protein n=1 Tax=Fusarium redolens TaxID=48865 RepID=A0A9P9HCP5_FUSRE|nr:beta-lactamase/transpeptidase-like protein [Fusarium redolens]KAH7255205.1 beta-lactamase/transpeptidase-like protein [Fusarium redolens]